MGVGGDLGKRILEETEVIEKHLHNREKWFGLALVPDAELHVADRMAIANNPFLLTAGADDFGAWVQILGSEDTPVTPEMILYEGRRFMVTDTDSTNEFIIQIVAGESADIAARLAAEEFTETPYISATNSNDSGVGDILSTRIPVGQKAWAKCRCIGASGTILAFYFGIHEYPE